MNNNDNRYTYTDTDKIIRRINELTPNQLEDLRKLTKLVCDTYPRRTCCKDWLEEPALLDAANITEYVDEIEELVYKNNLCEFLNEVANDADRWFDDNIGCLSDKEIDEFAYKNGVTQWNITCSSVWDIISKHLNAA